MSTQQERVVDQARKDTAEDPDISIDIDAPVIEVRDGYWVQAWIFIDKEIV